MNKWHITFCAYSDGRYRGKTPKTRSEIYFKSSKYFFEVGYKSLVLRRCYRVFFISVICCKNLVSVLKSNIILISNGIYYFIFQPHCFTYPNCFFMVSKYPSINLHNRVFQFVFFNINPTIEFV